MTPFHPQEGEKIPPSQVVWQVGEVGMNGWLLYALVTSGVTLPLVIWTVLEIVMNFWILTTMIKVGIRGKKDDS